MPNSASARKRVRQNETCRIRNKSAKSELRTLVKRLQAQIEAKQRDEAEKLHRAIVAKIDRGSQRHLFHKNAAARQKAQLARLMSSSF